MSVAKFYRPSEIAHILGVSPSCIAGWVKQGKFPAPTIRVSRTSLWDRQAVINFLHIDGDPLEGKFCKGEVKSLHARNHIGVVLVDDESSSVETDLQPATEADLQSATAE